MPHQINLTAPIQIGQYPNQITVSAVRIAAVSFNAQHGYESQAIAVLSLVIEDVATGAVVANPVWKDAAALTRIKALLALGDPSAAGQTIEQGLLAHAQTALDPASGKPLVPAGTIAASS